VYSPICFGIRTECEPLQSLLILQYCFSIGLPTFIVIFPPVKFRPSLFHRALTLIKRTVHLFSECIKNCPEAVIIIIIIIIKGLSVPRLSSTKERYCACLLVDITTMLKAAVLLKGYEAAKKAFYSLGLLSSTLLPKIDKVQGSPKK